MASPASPDWAAVASNSVMGALFASAAYVQLNDPDPLAWVGVYATGSALCVTTAMIAARKLPPVHIEVALPVMLAAITYPFYMLVRSGNVLLRVLISAFGLQQPGSLTEKLSFAALKQLIEVEEAREVAGMLLLLSWLIFFSSATAIETPPLQTAAANAAKKVLTSAPRVAAPTAEQPEPAHSTWALLTSVFAGPSAWSLAFAGFYCACWVGWVMALKTGSVSVGDHCQGML